MYWEINGYHYHVCIPVNVSSEKDSGRVILFNVDNEPAGQSSIIHYYITVCLDLLSCLMMVNETGVDT